MATLSVINVNLEGATPLYVPVDAGGDEFINKGRTFLHIKNSGSGGGPVTVTITSRFQCDQGFDHDVGVVVAAASSEMVGPFPAVRFNDDDGIIDVSYSGTTGMTIAAIALGV